jgi:two-component system, OmpR family, response regulator RstA
MNNQTLLLVEDDAVLAETIKDYLTLEGFSVSIESDGAVAQQRIVVENPDLVILDVMLPGKDGISVCREVRPHYNGYIIMFTAREDEVDQIVGLELGADDYLIKPIKPRLLLAKVKSFLRRSVVPNDGISAELSIGSLTIDVNGRNVNLEDSEVNLTSAEFDLLVLLAKNAGEILSRDLITKSLKGGEYDGMERGIDNKISQLRKKLKDDGRIPHRIKTIRGKGYVLSPGAWDT